MARAGCCGLALVLLACNGASPAAQAVGHAPLPPSAAASEPPAAASDRLAPAAQAPSAQPPVGPAPLAAALAVEPVAEAHLPPSAAAPIARDNARVSDALRYDPADPLADLERADELDRGAAQARGAPAAIPARGCALDGQARRIWPAPGIANVAAFGDDFVVTGYARDAQTERVFVVHVTAAGEAAPVASVRVEPPHAVRRSAGPGIAASLQHGARIAYTTGAGVLLTQLLQVGASRGAGASLELARGVDTRFAPAVSLGKRATLIAYTLGSTPMRTKLARIGPKGDVLEVHDVTPQAMGAAAPAFVQGSEPLLLVTADARDGMSPIARTQLDDGGVPRGTEVAASVGMMSEPPQLTAAGASFGGFVGYAGLGAAATSAIGLVQISPKGGAPAAMVKGTAYGTLRVAATSAGDRLYFAADTPLAPGKNPKRSITLLPIDAQGRGTSLTISSPSGDAAHVSIARAQDGRLALVWNGGDAVYLAYARCDED
jgi:hypothetical protein